MRNWIKLLTLPCLTLMSYAAQGAQVSSVVDGGGLYALATAIAISIAAAGGALAQGKIGASAMEGLSRNPSAQKNMFVPMILGLAFIESLVIFAFVVAFLIVGKF